MAELGSYGGRKVRAAAAAAESSAVRKDTTLDRFTRSGETLTAYLAPLSELEKIPFVASGNGENMSEKWTMVAIEPGSPPPPGGKRRIRIRKGGTTRPAVVPPPEPVPGEPRLTIASPVERYEWPASIFWNIFNTEHAVKGHGGKGNECFRCRSISEAMGVSAAEANRTAAWLNQRNGWEGTAHGRDLDLAARGKDPGKEFLLDTWANVEDQIKGWEVRDRRSRP